MQGQITDFQRTGLQAISALSRAIEARDPYTAGHNSNVAKLARAIAQELGMSHDSIEAVRVGATVHDIGKLAVPLDILVKPRRLHEHELSLIRMHPIWGAEILSGVDFPWPVASIVKQHHERLDGSGYPDGLSDDAILPESKVVAVADVVDSMVSHRPYRAALGEAAAQKELQSLRGAELCPKAVDACFHVLSSGQMGYGT